MMDSDWIIASCLLPTTPTLAPGVQRSLVLFARKLCPHKKRRTHTLFGASLGVWRIFAVRPRLWWNCFLAQGGRVAFQIVEGRFLESERERESFRKHQSSLVLLLLQHDSARDPSLSLLTRKGKAQAHLFVVIVAHPSRFAKINRNGRRALRFID